MKTPQKWTQSITNQANIAEIIDSLIIQIQKDFLFFNEEIVFSAAVKESYELLFKELNYFLLEKFGRNTERLYPILYRIDILEKDIKKAIESDFFTAITENIILKELQKVIIKKFYKSPN